MENGLVSPSVEVLRKDADSRHNGWVMLLLGVFVSPSFEPCKTRMRMHYNHSIVPLLPITSPAFPYPLLAGVPKFYSESDTDWRPAPACGLPASMLLEDIKINFGAIVVKEAGGVRGAGLRTISAVAPVTLPPHEVWGALVWVGGNSANRPCPPRKITLSGVMGSESSLKGVF